MDFLNQKYLNDLEQKAHQVLNNDYAIDKLNFNKFEFINAYLIHDAINRNYNLLINSYSRDENENLYVPAIISLAIFELYKNYCDYKPQPQIGEIVQKDKLRYKVTKILDDCIEIKNDSNGTIKYPTFEQYKNYIITTADILTDRKLKLGFESYKSFFNNIFKGELGIKIPSKFSNKSIIITSKELISKLKNYKYENEEIHKSLPFRYIAKSGEITDNLPIDPMIYIVNDYETAQKYIISNPESNVDTIVFIGDSKYRDCLSIVENDLRNQRFKNCIFIGSEDITMFQNLKKWNWTIEELNFLNKLQERAINHLSVNNLELTNKIQLFHKIVSDVEKEKEINLKHLYDFVNSLMAIIIPDSKSRLNRQVDELKIIFQSEGKELLERECYGQDDYDFEEEWKNISTAFSNCLNALTSIKWETFKKLEKVNYLIVPSKVKDSINEELKSYRYKPEAITYKDFEKVNSHSCFLSLYGYNHFKNIYTSNFNVSIILYQEESERFNMFEQRYKNEITNELKSLDRKFISGLEYFEELAKEDVNQLIERLFMQENHSFDDLECEKRVNLLCRILFDDETTKETESNKSVLLCKNGSSRIEKIGNLIIGDEVRIYDNTTKEQLFEIAIKEDTEGRFQKIQEDSKLWKCCLKKYSDNKRHTLQTLL